MYNLYSKFILITDYRRVAYKLLRLLNESEQTNDAIILKQSKKIEDLEYKLKVAESKYNQTIRLLNESERQRCKALELLDTNEYRR